MTWVIRQITAEDAACLVPLLAQVHAVHAEALPDRYQPAPAPHGLLAALRDRMEDPETTSLAAFAPDASALGGVIVRIGGREPSPLFAGDWWGHLGLVAVDRARRRAGIGPALIDAMKTRLRAQGIGRLRADHAAFNAPSAALMRKAGLQPIAIIVEGTA